MEQADLTAATLPTLYQWQTAAAAMLAQAQAGVTAIHAELQRRLAESAKRSLDQLGKSHGSVTLELQDGFSAKTETKQTVTWDSEKLQAIAKTLPWERAVAIFGIKFSVSETIYKGISASDPALGARLDDARTTKVGEPSVVLIKADQA
jgi:hypothetical protein